MARTWRVHDAYQKVLVKKCEGVYAIYARVNYPRVLAHFTDTGHLTRARWA